MATIDLNKVFTLKELKKMKTISDKYPSEQVARHLVHEVIAPVLPRIEKAVGQEMDPGWLAYACIYHRPWPDSKK